MKTLLITTQISPFAGNWHWTRALNEVTFTPKGKRRPTVVLFLSNNNNTLYGAMLKVVNEEKKLWANGNLLKMELFRKDQEARN